MKKLVYFLFVSCVIAFASCSSDDDDVKEAVQLNLDKAHYTLAKGSVEVKLLADAAPATTISVPVSFAGTAVEGTDFNASAKAFTLKAGETEATITLTRIEESIGETDKELVVNLGTAPEGFRIGVLNYTSVALLSSNAVIMSFDNATDVLTESGSYNVALTRLQGGTYLVTEAMQLEVEVDGSSTAVEGTHFEFVGGTHASIPVKKNRGTVNIKFLKKEAGKDKLVLRLKEKDGFGYGNNPTITITIQGQYLLAGTWAFDKIVNKDYYESAWYIDTSDFPTGTSSDQIKFEGTSYQEYTFIPTLSGDLKNYFGTESCTVTYVGELEKTLEEQSGMGSRVIVKVATLKFPSVNANFSATNKNMREAVVSFRIIQSEGKEILECTIDDFEPTDFMADIYEMYKDMGEDPIMLSAPLRLYFTKVK